jgi:hypothetical protein
MYKRNREDVSTYASNANDTRYRDDVYEDHNNNNNNNHRFEREEEDAEYDEEEYDEEEESVRASTHYNNNNNNNNNNGGNDEDGGYEDDKHGNSGSMLMEEFKEDDGWITRQPQGGKHTIAAAARMDSMFFGAPTEGSNRDTAYSSVPRAHWSMKDFQRRNCLYLAELQDYQFKRVLDWPVTEILNLKIVSPDTIIVMGSWNTPDSLLGRTPEETASVVVKSQYTSRETSLTRYGMGFSILQGFMTHPAGRDSYLMSINGISRSLGATSNCMVLNALMRTKEERFEHGAFPYMKWTGDLTRAQFRVQLKESFNAWARIQKSNFGYSGIIAESRDKLASGPGATLNYVIAPRGADVYVRGSTAENNMFISGRSAGHRRDITKTGDLEVPVTRIGMSFKSDPEDPVYDPQFQNVEIGGFARMEYKTPPLYATSELMMEPSRRDVLIFNENRDDWEKIQFKKALLDDSRLFVYNQHTDKYTWNDEGHKHPKGDDGSAGVPLSGFGRWHTAFRGWLLAVGGARALTRFGAELTYMQANAPNVLAAFHARVFPDAKNLPQYDIERLLLVQASLEEIQDGPAMRDDVNGEFYVEALQGLIHHRTDTAPREMAATVRDLCRQYEYDYIDAYTEVWQQALMLYMFMCHHDTSEIRNVELMGAHRRIVDVVNAHVATPMQAVKLVALIVASTLDLPAYWQKFGTQQWTEWLALEQTCDLSIQKRINAEDDKFDFNIDMCKGVLDEALSPCRMPEAIRAMIEYGFSVPISVLLVRPYQTYRMGTVIAVAVTPDLGHLMQGGSNFIVQDDAVRKVHMGHYTTHLGVAIERPQNVILTENALCGEHISGGGVSVPEPDEPFSRWTDTSEGSGHDMMVFPVPGSTDNIDDVFDITGQFPRVITSDNFRDYDCVRGDEYHKSRRGTHYRSTEFTHAVWDIAPSVYSSQEREIEPQSVQLGTNTIVHQQSQYVWSEDGQFSTRIKGMGHWQDQVYTGVAAERSGRKPAILRGRGGHSHK